MLTLKMKQTFLENVLTLKSSQFPKTPRKLKKDISTKIIMRGPTFWFLFLKILQVSILSRQVAIEERQSQRKSQKNEKKS